MLMVSVVSMWVTWSIVDCPVHARSSGLHLIQTGRKLVPDGPALLHSEPSLLSSLSTFRSPSSHSLPLVNTNDPLILLYGTSILMTMLVLP